MTRLQDDSTSDRRPAASVVVRVALQFSNYPVLVAPKARTLAAAVRHVTIWPFQTTAALYP